MNLNTDIYEAVDEAVNGTKDFCEDCGDIHEADALVEGYCDECRNAEISCDEI